MLRYVVRKVLYAIPTLIGVLTLTWFLFYCTATPVVIARRNMSARAPKPAQILRWINDHGYGEPKIEDAQKDGFGRFALALGLKPRPDKALLDGVRWPPSLGQAYQLKSAVWDTMTFQFGKSDQTKQDIKGRIKLGMGPSFVVSATIFVFELALSILFAAVAAYFRGTYVDKLTTILCVIMMSIVQMVYIIGFQFVFCKLLRLGPNWGFDPNPLGMLRYLLVPTVIGIVSGIATEIRLYRTFFLEEVNLDYVRTARAKGVPESQVLLKHVLKNALVPIVTNTVAVLPGLILGQLLLESFFGIPGLGAYLVDAIEANDFAVVRAMVFLGSLLYIVGLILTDIVYGLVDPRVRLS